MASVPNFYEVDAVVVDVAEPTAIRRRADTELTMQVLTGAAWHRRTPDLATTACGMPFHSSFTPVRRESHVGPLCGECFTAFERAHSELLEKISREDT